MLITWQRMPQRRGNIQEAMDRISQAYETYVSVIRNSLAQSVNQVQMAEVFRIVYPPTH